MAWRLSTYESCACIGAGASSRIIAACIDGRLRPIMGASLFLEYEDVLARDTLFRSARLNEAERQLLRDVFVNKCDWHPIYFRWRPNLRDEGDNHLVELAVAGNAYYIVTSNIRDFRNQDLRFDNLKVVTPDELNEELAK
jgi:predicted nucleic acid-binding protein